MLYHIMLNGLSHFNVWARYSKEQKIKGSTEITKKV